MLFVVIFTRCLYPSHLESPVFLKPGPRPHKHARKGSLWRRRPTAGTPMVEPSPRQWLNPPHADRCTLRTPIVAPSVRRSLHPSHAHHCTLRTPIFAPLSTPIVAPFPRQSLHHSLADRCTIRTPIVAPFPRRSLHSSHAGRCTLPTPVVAPSLAPLKGKASRLTGFRVKKKKH